MEFFSTPDFLLLDWTRRYDQESHCNNDELWSIEWDQRSFEVGEGTGDESSPVTSVTLILSCFYLNSSVWATINAMATREAIIHYFNL
ncbi:hypothetical protein KIN20_007239 [Parelaphostrongylus tenuis]|uniref:Uncharacterized protein n=1 Tax=Parelaphostrongylus tenuis TaxID=148309 RepID=A0AAD5M553_PARTN|nr:hypothetical protein KIN20_007239 [Parelaphostrongylus tenuis]